MSKRKSKREQKQEQEAREMQIMARRREVVQYRVLGVSYRAIGEALKISHEQARADYLAARAELGAETKETLEELRELANDRLDMARTVIAPKIRQGDLGAIDRWIKIEERSAKLNGLDAPQQTELSGEVGVKNDGNSDDAGRDSRTISRLVEIIHAAGARGDRGDDES